MFAFFWKYKYSPSLRQFRTLEFYLNFSICSCIGFDTVVPFSLDQLLLAVVQTLQTQLKSILSRLLRLNCFSLTENQTVCPSLFGCSYFNSAPKLKFYTQYTHFLCWCQIVSEFHVVIFLIQILEYL